MLNQQQIDHFHDQGFLVITPELDPLLPDRIISKIQPHYEPVSRQDPQAPTRLQDYWQHVDEVRQLATNADILGMLAQLFGRRPLPFQTLNFPIGTRQPPHSDTIHFSSLPAGYMCGVWVALEDIDESQGPLRFYPGSHKLPEHTMQSLGLRPGFENYSDYERAITAVVARAQLQPQLATLRKGQALIWHANLLHGGAEQHDLSRSRHSQVTHYYFENCQYYIPMLSKPEQLHLREPGWIPTDPPGMLSRIKGLFRRNRTSG